jgi:hypothetical protein
LLKIVKVNTHTPPAQLRYFLPEDLYLLSADKPVYQQAETQAETTAAEVIIEAPATPSIDTAANTTAATPAAIETETPAPAFKYTGLNQKNFLVLCHYTNGPQMPDAHLTALINTITRINFTQDDLAIVNLAQYPQATWLQFLSFFEPQKLLVLGTDALPAGLLQLTQNQIQQTGNCQALYTFSFNEMMGNKENTKAFWNQIKTF